jgi:uncharacterized surface protein with fasciclin (FAS1) repeats
MKRAVSLFGVGLGLALACSGMTLAGCGDDDDDNVAVQGRGGSGGKGGQGGSPGTGGQAGTPGTGGQAGTPGTGGQAGQDGGKNIVQVASANADFSTLVELVGAAGLAEALQGAGPLTVFAPNNAAFASFLGVLKDGPGCVNFLKSDAGKETLGQILKYHVVGGDKELKAADIVAALGAGAVEPATLLGADAKIKVTAETAGDKTTVLLNGGKGGLGGADVIATDVDASNGVIHVINQVILSDALRGALNALPADNACRPKSIVDAVVGTPSLSTLKDLVTAAELVGTLQGAGPFTVFAPDNDAFTSFLGGVNSPAACVTFLKGDGKAVLKDILLYHVAPGDLSARDVVASTQAGITTALSEGSPAAPAKIVVKINGTTVTLNDGSAKLGGADVKATDVTLGNGIVHVINDVILSPGLLQTLGGLPNDAACKPKPAAP